MRCCQLCGCTSWGPIGNPEELARLAEFIVGVKDHEFMRCDGCKSIGRKDLLENLGAYLQPPSPSADATFDLGGVFAKVLPSIPQPPTRTERLLHTVLQANPRTGKASGQPSADYAQWAVALTRVIEWELDHPNGPAASEVTAETPWLILSWSAREDFNGWCVGMWDLINKSDRYDFTTTQDYPDRWLDVAASYAIGK